MGERKTGLPPILPRGPIRRLILGSLPSDASIAKQEYYRHPGNHFWRVLAECGVIADADAPYRSRVAELRLGGIAVWDLYASADREGSGDDKIEDAIKSIKELGGLTPRGIRTHLGLNKPIYQPTAAYGHFGRKAEGDFFPWEKTDLVEKLKAAL